MSKRALSGVVATVILTALALTSISIIYIYIERTISLSNQEVFCNNQKINENIRILRACYLSDNELLVIVKKTSQDTKLMRFIFSNKTNEAIFEMKNKKCLDIREKNSEYGKECIINFNGIKKYVFNIEKGYTKVNLEEEFENNEKPCFMSSKNIEKTCES